MATMAMPLDKAISALRRRALGVAWIRRAGPLCGWTLSGCSAAALLVRGGASWERGEAAWLLAPALIAPIAALVLARRERPSPAQAATWLDVRSGGSGFVVTEQELGATAWSPRTEAALAAALERLPRVELGALLRPLAVALALATLALWIELPRDMVGPPPAVSAAALERVEERLEVLKDALALEPELERELEERLDAARTDSEAGNPESTYEALDQLDERIEQAAQEAELAAQQALALLQRATSEAELAQAQEALQNAAQSMGAAGLSKDLPQKLERELAQAAQSLAGEPLSSADLARLAQELKGALDGRMSKLAGGRLVDPSKLGKLGEQLSLEDFDEEHECDESCKQPGGT